MPNLIPAALERLEAGGYNLWAIAAEFFLIALVVYTVLRFLHGTRGARLFQGVFFLLVAGFLVVRVLADNFEWTRVRVLYQYFVFGVFLTTLVVFQPELRRGLMRIGETRWLRPFLGTRRTVVDPIVQTVTNLAKNKIGALIAIERDVRLGALADSGTRIDARLSAELLETIFWPGSALHDMGVIIQEHRIVAAGCQFPLAESEDVERSLGSRHRAAVGLSLESDALIIIVSEETGIVSVAEAGLLTRHLGPDELGRMLGRGLDAAGSSGDDRLAA